MPAEAPSLPWARAARTYLQAFLGRNRGPVYLIHFITLRCNAECSHCFVPINTGRRELSLEEIRRFAGSCPPLLYVSLTGGEPLLREDFTDIVRAYADGPAPLVVNTVTNGAFPERAESVARRVAEECPRTLFSMAVSLDGLEEDHDRLRRRPGLFRQALETVRRLAHLQKELPRFRTEVQFTLTPDNQSGAAETLRELGRLAGTDNVFFTARRVAHGPGGSPGLSADLYRSLMERAESDWMRSGAAPALFRAVTAARNRLVHRALADGRMTLSCLAGRAAGVLWDDGTVYGCELIREPLGRLRDHGLDLARVWAGADARAFAERVVRERCFCTHECFNAVNVAFRPHRLLTLR
jgi:MoaA/NifB/PqqE/SkfB family radical SAM enzyme